MIRGGEAASDYRALSEVLQGAYEQAAYGKGKERHAAGEPFEEQICCYLLKHTGVGGAVFQACKKALESCRLPYPANVRELQGAINYAAAAIIEMERLAKSSEAVASIPVIKQVRTCENGLRAERESIGVLAIKERHEQDS